MVDVLEILKKRSTHVAMFCLALFLVGFHVGRRTAPSSSSSALTTQNQHRAQLKNALLTHALLKVRGDDVSNLPVADYSKFDGSVLPAPSGASLEMACSSYTFDDNPAARAAWKKDRWFTPAMDAKYRAVDLYMDKNLSDPKSCDRLLEDYIAAVEAAPASGPPEAPAPAPAPATPRSPKPASKKAAKSEPAATATPAPEAA